MLRSSTVKDADEKKIKRVIPKASNKIIDQAVARLYVAHPHPDQWTYTGLAGALCLVNDLVGNTFYLKLVDIVGNEGVIWDQELYVDFAYNQDRTFFHSFELEDCLAGVLFEDKSEAAHFHKRVTQRQKHASKATLNNTAAIPRKAANAVSRPSGVAPSAPGPRGDASGSVRRRNQLKGQVYYDDQPPVEWRALYADLATQGITEDMIAANTSFIKTFIAQQGGPLVGLEPPIPRKYAPKEERDDRRPPPPPPSAPSSADTGYVSGAASESSRASSYPTDSMASTPEPPAVPAAQAPAPQVPHEAPKDNYRATPQSPRFVPPPIAGAGSKAKDIASTPTPPPAAPSVHSVPPPLAGAGRGAPPPAPPPRTAGGVPPPPPARGGAPAPPPPRRVPAPAAAAPPTLPNRESFSPPVVGSPIPGLPPRSPAVGGGMPPAPVLPDRAPAAAPPSLPNRAPFAPPVAPPVSPPVAQAPSPALPSRTTFSPPVPPQHPAASASPPAPPLPPMHPGSPAAPAAPAAPPVAPPMAPPVAAPAAPAAPPMAPPLPTAAAPPSLPVGGPPPPAPPPTFGGPPPPAAPPLSAPGLPPAAPPLPTSAPVAPPLPTGAPAAPPLPGGPAGGPPPPPGPPPPGGAPLGGASMGGPALPTDLMASITQGNMGKLKKMDKSHLDRPSALLSEAKGETPPPSSTPAGDDAGPAGMASALVAALIARKGKVAHSDDEEEDDDAWD